MATTHRTVSVTSLSSITSENSVTKKKQKSTGVTIGFKYHWFETTLNFIKDERRMSLNYGVTPAQAIFIRDVLNFEANPSLKLEKYAPLYEALKIFGLKYSFKLVRIKKNVVMLQKILKPHKQLMEPDPTSQTLSPKMEREKKVIDRISREYMVEKAQTILEFIDDPTRVTLEFTKVKPLESMFLQTVMTAARPLFPEHAQMLEHIKKLKPTLDFSLQVVVGKINKKTNERTVTFKKDPKFTKKAKRSRENSRNRSNISLNNNFVPSTKEQPKISPQNITHNKENSTQKLNSMETAQNKQNSMQIEQTSTPNNANSMQNVQNSTQNIQNSTQSEQNSMQVDENSQEPMDVDSPRSIGSMNSCSAISVQSEPVRGVERTRSASAMGVGSNTGLDKPLGNPIYGSQNNLNLPKSTTKTHVSRRDVNPRKAKLLEDMSMPVKLDKPARMMEKMGWNGGPLGIRGIGITEPIIPALDLVSGAGFGHVKPAQPEVCQQKNFRQELLETILDLVQTEKVTVSLVYPNMMSKKEINFVRHAVTSFSERKKITLKNTEEAKVAKLVIDALKKLPNVVIHGTASACKKQVTLKKVIIVRPQANLPLLPQTDTIKVEHLLKLAETVGGYTYAHKTPKQKKYFGTRITILIEILHFLQFNDQFKELLFEASLSKQESEYITKAVQSLNRRTKPPMCSAMTLEDDIWNNIMRVIGDNVLVVKFDNRKVAVVFEKAVAMEMKTYKNSLMNELHSINNNNNNDAVQNINVNNGYNRVRKVNNPNNIVVSIQKNLYASKVNVSKQTSNKTITENSSAIENKAIDLNKSFKSTIIKQDSEDINKILEKRLQIFDKPKTDNDIHGKNDALTEGKDIQSEDDDVILIETVREIVVISDDETEDTPSAENVQNTDRSDKILERHGLEMKVSNVEVNLDVIKVQINLQDTQKETDNISQWSTDINISNGQRSEVVDMTISNSQDSTAGLHLSNIEENTDIDKTKDFENVTITNRNDITTIEEKTQNNIACDISKTQSKESIDTSKENLDLLNIRDSTKLDVSNIQENANVTITNRNYITTIEEVTQNIIVCDISKTQNKESIDTSKESLDKSLLNIRESTNLDVSNIQENANIGIVNISANTSISSVENSILDVSKIKGLDGESIEKADIDNKVIVKIEPKKEKLSYSEEFDKDLHDLAEVLLLDDDDVFDYTIVKKEKEERVERPSSKRSRSDSVESSPDYSKKTKIFTFKNSKNLLIVPKDYPSAEITKECTIKIQTILSDAIEKCKELPLLKCHGIQDGGLVYSCHNEQSLFFLENSLSVAIDYKIISDVIIKKKPYDVKIRINSLLDNIKTLFSRLELYNAGLITDCWCVKETRKYDDYIVISVEIDEYSYKYICDNSFCLYAGIDEARFSVVWD